LAKDAGVKGVVYFSMVNSDVFADTPHASAKFAAEQMIERFDIPATILRPNCFFQNDAMVKGPLLEQGRYGMPIGAVGVAMVDTRDIAEVAALEMLGRERAPEPLPRSRVEISGPEILTGSSIAAIWSDVLGKPVTYAGDDTARSKSSWRSTCRPRWPSIRRSCSAASSATACCRRPMPFKRSRKSSAAPCGLTELSPRNCKPLGGTADPERRPRKVHAVTVLKRLLVARVLLLAGPCAFRQRDVESQRGSLGDRRNASAFTVRASSEDLHLGDGRISISASEQCRLQHCCAVVGAGTQTVRTPLARPWQTERSCPAAALSGRRPS
jgi:hypothetical protein